MKQHMTTRINGLSFMTRSRLLLFSLFASLLLVLAGCGSENEPTRAEVDIFAQCLTEAGAVMYGAFWCPHCARTKQRFGASFRHIDYVECDPRGDNEQSQLCLEKNIEAYDTWEFADGSRVIGEPSFEILAQNTGCALPGGTA